jgi:hypothetical protein
MGKSLKYLPDNTGRPLIRGQAGEQFQTVHWERERRMLLSPADGERTTPQGGEDSVELKKMLTSCMINRQILVRMRSLDRTVCRS